MKYGLRHSKTKTLSLIGLLCTLSLLGGCKEQIVSVGAAAPDLAAFDAADKTLDLSHFKGKPVVLEFWSATCGACLVMMKKWQHVLQSRAEDFHMIGIGIDKDPPSLITFAKELGITFPLGADQMGITRERYQITVTPTTFFIDSNGIVKEMHIGYSEHMDLNQKIDQLIHQ